MRFIHILSYSFANYLMYQLKENHEKRRVYYYGFQIFIGSIVKAVIMISVSALLGILMPALIILFVFGTLRVLAGGFHMDTYGKCIATSTILFVATGLIAQYTYKQWATIYIIALLILTVITTLPVIYKWAPRDTPNKPITSFEEIKKYKKLSFIYIIVWVLLNSTIILIEQIKGYKYLDMVVISSCFGVLLEIMTVTPAGYGLFERISGKKRITV